MTDDLYTAIAAATGVDRAVVRKVLLAACYSGGYKVPEDTANLEKAKEVIGNLMGALDNCGHPGTMENCNSCESYRTAEAFLKEIEGTCPPKF